MAAEAKDITDTNGQRPKPVVLCILDGWGIAPPYAGNALAVAHLPHFEELVGRYPVTALSAAGEAVGVPWGEMGNSKVGHLNLGAGRIIYQDVVRITKAISDGSFYENPVLTGAVAYAKKNQGAVHLAGLLSTGGIHALFDHLIALLSLCQRQKAPRVFLHLFTDGRDMPYNSALALVTELERTLAEIGVGKIASIAGRFYAMDRDNNWDRTARAYRAIAQGESERRFPSAAAALEDSYQREVYDEQLEPAVIAAPKEKIVTVNEGDALIVTNFRADRARQITKAFCVPGFDKFPGIRSYHRLYCATLTEYEENLPVEVAYKPSRARQTLGEMIARAGLRQLRIAETEKYAHVTYFFNGGIETAFVGEDRVVIPSPGNASYADAPLMAAPAVTKRLLEEIDHNTYDFILVNYANADMVGHTGNLDATVQAVEYLDEVLGKLSEAVLKADGVLCVTADHGNAEELFDMQHGAIDKEHTTNPVPFLIIGNRFEGKKIAPEDFAGSDLSVLSPRGMLADVAPTILDIMGLDEPEEMTGRSVL